MKQISRVLLALLIAVALSGCVQDNGEAPPAEDEEGTPAEPTGNGIDARFEVTAEDPRVGVPIQFDASGTQIPPPEDNETDEEPAPEYEWDFGDGRSGSGISVSHTYNDPGQFTVTLFVRMEERQDNASEVLRVLPPDTDDLNESWEGSLPLGAPVENGMWMAEHDFSVQAPQENVVIGLSGSGTGAAMSLYLYDSAGDEVASETGSGPSKEITLPFLDAGSYTLVVHMTAGAQGSYELTAMGTATFVEDTDPMM